jgi:hypothetical protein
LDQDEVFFCEAQKLLLHQQGDLILATAQLHSSANRSETGSINAHSPKGALQEDTGLRKSGFGSTT